MAGKKLFQTKAETKKYNRALMTSVVERYKNQKNAEAVAKGEEPDEDYEAARIAPSSAKKQSTSKPVPPSKLTSSQQKAMNAVVTRYQQKKQRDALHSAIGSAAKKAEERRKQDVEKAKSFSNQRIKPSVSSAKSQMEKKQAGKTAQSGTKNYVGNNGAMSSVAMNYDKRYFDRNSKEYYTTKGAAARREAERDNTVEYAAALEKKKKEDPLLGVSGAEYERYARPYRNLTDAERRQYNQIYAARGKEQADAYLKSLEGELQERNVSENMAKRETENPVTRAAKGAVLGFGVGVQGAIEGSTKGLKNFLTGETEFDRPSEDAQTFQRIRDSSKGAERVLYDTAQGAGNMAPSLAIGALAGMATGGIAPAAGAASTAARFINPQTVSKAAGLGTMAAGIIGNTYEDTVKEGYSTDEARKYALASAGSEAATEYLLGGIGGLSGQFLKRGVAKLAPGAAKKLGTAGAKAMQTGVDRFLADYGMDMLSEGGEEYVQQLVDNGIRNVLLGENNEISLTDPDAWYSALLGATTAGVLNMPAAGARLSSARAIDRWAENSGIGTDSSYAEIADSIDTAPESYVDAAGAVNEDVLAKAEEAKRQAARLAEKEASGMPVGNLEKADLMNAVYDLNQAAAENQQATSGAKRVSVPLLPVDADSAAGFARTEPATRTQWKNILNNPQFAAADVTDGINEYHVERTADGYSFERYRNGAPVSAAAYASGEVGSGTEQDVLSAMPVQDMRGPELRAEVAYTPAYTGLEQQNRVTNTAEAAESPMINEGFAEMPEAFSEETATEPAGMSSVESAEAVNSDAIRRIEQLPVKPAKAAGNAVQNVTETESARRASEATAPERDIKAYADEMSVKLSDSANNVLVREYDGEIPVQQYVRAFRHFWTAGRYGIDQRTALNSPYTEYLTDRQMLAAWKAGMQDQNRAKAEAAARGYEKGEAREGGLRSASDAATPAQRRAADTIGKRTGLNIEIREDITGSAEYDAENGIIRINPYTDNFNQSLSHELTHFLQDYDAAGYKAYKNIAIDALARSQKTSIDKLFEKYENAYAKTGTTPTADEIYDEMVADASGLFLNDQNFINRVVKKDRGLAERIRDFFADIADALRALINTGDLREAAKALRENEARYRTAQNLWANALEKASERYRSGETRKEKTDTRFSIKELDDGTKYVNVDVDQARFDGLTPKEQIKEAARVIREQFAGKTFDYGGGKVTVSGKTAKEYKGKHYSEEVMSAKARLSPELDNLMNVSEHIGHTEDDGHHPAATGGWDYYRSIFRVNGKFYTGDINVMNRDTDRLLYDVYKINEAPANIQVNPSALPVLYAPGVRENLNPETSSDKNLSQNALKIKKQLDLKEPVEETKTLVAVHNLTPGKLSKLAAYEGIPMPSIAVTKASQGWNKFGDISFVFDRSTIDPEFSDKNKVYGADAWTPTMPKIDYEYNEEKLSRAAGTIRRLAAELPEPFRKDAESTAYSIANDAERFAGYQGMVEKALDDTALKAAYLVSRGETVEDRITTIQKQIPEDDLLLGQLFLEEAPDYKLIPAYQDEEGSRKQTAQYREAGKAAYRKYLHKKFPKASDEKIEQRIENGPFAKTYMRMRSLANRIQEGKITEEQQVRDTAGMEKDVNSRVDQGAYKQWVEDLLKDVEIGTGVWNGKEYLTPSGNRRTFKQLHYPVTAENIVRAMLSQNDDVRNTVGFMGAKSVRAVAVEDFESIDAMHAAEGNIKDLTSEDFDKIQENINDRLNELLFRIISRKGSEDVMAMDSLGSCILEVARMNPTAKKFESYLKKYHWPVTPAEAKELSNIVQEIKDMPVDMFEAKPERVVGWDEIKAALVPIGSEDTVFEELQSKGVNNIITYDPLMEGDRLRKLQSIEGVRFQLNLDSSDESIEGLARENADLRAANVELTAALSSARFVPKKEDIRKTAKALLKETNSYMNLETAEAKLTSLYNYIHNSDYIDGEELSTVAADIAGEMIMRSKAEYDPDDVRRYTELTSYLRKTPLSIADIYRADFDVYGGYDAFRKKYFGTLSLRKNGAPIDTIYTELQERFPEYLSADIYNPADQLMAIGDAVDALRPKPLVNTGGMTEADFDSYRYMVGQQIYDAYFDVSYRPAGAGTDLAAAKQRYHASLNKYKNNLRSRYKQAEREAYRKNQEEIKKLRERYDKLSKEDRARARERMDALRDQKNQRLAAEQSIARERIANTRDFYRGRSYKNTIQKDAAEMTRWLMNPTDKKHVPDALRASLAEFLKNIDFSSNYLNQQGEKTQRTQLWEKFQRTYQDIIDEYAVIANNEGMITGPDGENYMDIDPDILNKMNSLKASFKNMTKLDDMTSYQLKQLKDVVKAIKHSVQDANRMIGNKRFEKVQGAAVATMESLDKKREKIEKSGVRGAIESLRDNNMLDAYTRFYTFGDAALSVYNELREGHNMKIRRTREGEVYMGKLLRENGVTQKELKNWSSETAQLIRFKTSRGDVIELKPSQLMSLYELMKRSQARKHVLEGGITTARVKVKKTGGGVKDLLKTAEILTWGKNVQVTQEDVVKLIEHLTPQQKAIADGVAAFMTQTTARWGNEASLKMYGYTKFNAEDYFPIRVDRNYVQTQTEKVAQSTQTIKNMGLTKPTTPNAGNPLVLEDIFDVYTRQVDQMGSYNAYLIPLSDMLKWYNYRDNQYSGSVKQSIERAFGKDAENYVRKLMEDVNGVGTNDRYFARALVSRFKGSAVGFNLRTAIQQPTAYVRAADEMSPKYLLEALAYKSELKTWENIKKYSAIAQWKDWGFYENDIGRSMKSILMGPQSTFDNIQDKQMWLNAKGDEKTWKKLWDAVELETKDRHKELEPGTDAFYKAVAARFDEIIDRTQVVDSVFHRSQLMRSKNDLNLMATSFMSEPTKSYNMIYRAAYDLVSSDDATTRKRAAKRLARAVTTFILSSAATSLVASVVSALRDDDKEKSFKEKYLETLTEDFIGNINPVSMIPFARDVLSIFEGYDVSRSDMQFVQEIYWTVNRWNKFLHGETNYTLPNMLTYSVKPVSSLFGVGVDNALRDIDGLLDTLIDAFGSTSLQYAKERADIRIDAKESTKTFVTLALKAYKKGEKETGDRIINDMLDAGIEQGEIDKRIKETLKEDERLQEAADAKLAGDKGTYTAILQELEKEGYQQELVESQVKSEIGARNPYEYSDLMAALDQITDFNSENYKPFNDMLAEFAKYKQAENGWDSKKMAEEIKKQLSKYYRPRYRDGNATERQRILNLLSRVRFNGKKLYEESAIRDWKEK